MAKTVVGSFDRFEDAQRAADELRAAGHSSDDISVVAQDTREGVATGAMSGLSSGSPGGDVHEQPKGLAGVSDHGDDTRGATTRSRETGHDAADDDVASGASTGAIAGGVIGGAAGLAAGLAGLAIPGIGPLIAAGPIVAALAGAGVGAVAGGLVGGLRHVGVSDSHADYYAESVRRGGALVVLRSQEDRATDAAALMQRHGAVDIEARVEQWRQTGWSGFDASAGPHRAEGGAAHGSPRTEAGTAHGSRRAEGGAASGPHGERTSGGLTGAAAAFGTAIADAITAPAAGAHASAAVQSAGATGSAHDPRDGIVRAGETPQSHGFIGDASSTGHAGTSARSTPLTDGGSAAMGDRAGLRTRTMGTDTGGAVLSDIDLDRQAGRDTIAASGSDVRYTATRQAGTGSGANLSGTMAAGASSNMGETGGNASLDASMGATDPTGAGTSSGPLGTGVAGTHAGEHTGFGSSNAGTGLGSHGEHVGSHERDTEPHGRGTTTAQTASAASGAQVDPATGGGRLGGTTSAMDIDDRPSMTASSAGGSGAASHVGTTADSMGAMQGNATEPGSASGVNAGTVGETDGMYGTRAPTPAAATAPMEGGGMSGPVGDTARTASISGSSMGGGMAGREGAVGGGVTGGSTDGGTIGPGMSGSGMSGSGMSGSGMQGATGTISGSGTSGMALPGSGTSAAADRGTGTARTGSAAGSGMHGERRDRDQQERYEREHSYASDRGGDAAGGDRPGLADDASRAKEAVKRGWERTKDAAERAMPGDADRDGK